MGLFSSVKLHLVVCRFRFDKLMNVLSLSQLINSRNLISPIRCSLRAKFHIGENFSNTKKTTVNMLPAHQCWSNYKVGVKEVFWKTRGRKIRNNRINEVIIHKENKYVGHTGLFYTILANIKHIWGSHRTVLHDTC